LPELRGVDPEKADLSPVTTAEGVSVHYPRHDTGRRRKRDRPRSGSARVERESANQQASQRVSVHGPAI
jgi:hypothetical protein